MRQFSNVTFKEQMNYSSVTNKSRLQNHRISGDMECFVNNECTEINKCTSHSSSFDRNAKNVLIILKIGRIFWAPHPYWKHYNKRTTSMLLLDEAKWFRN